MHSFQTARATLVTLLALCGTVAMADPDDSPVGPTHVALGDAANAKITRLAGDATAPVVVRDENEPWMYRAGEQYIGSPLPDGYPRPTAPGVVELKYFPSARRAEFGGASNSGMRGFWPLFQHISSRDIAMTAPVEMDMDTDGMTMSFLYQTRELGPVGEAEQGVVVRDTEPMWVVSKGFKGARTGSRVTQSLAELRAMIDELDGWKATDQTRWMGYNGPSTPRNKQWWEVQITVVPDLGNEGGDDEDDGAPVVEVDTPERLGG
ncbi:MAG: heme-binding protein [Planctomycetota bacterium]